MNTPPDELHTEIATLRSTISELRAEREWRPIATAPRDGTKILVWNANDYEAIYRHQKWNVWVDSDRDQNWGRAPTHWLPLPQPPVLAADVKEGA